jgi:hypothetical protein
MVVAMVGWRWWAGNDGDGVVCISMYNIRIFIEWLRYI